MKRAEKWFRTLMAVVLVLAFQKPAAVQAAEDISDSAVTSITVNTASTYDWATIQVTVNFTLPSGVESGDTITVSWPTEDSTTGLAYLEGSYQQDISVTITTIDGSSAVIGTAEVLAGGATITFNENVTKYIDVSGYLTFFATTHLVDSASTGDSGTAVISSGNQTVGVKITKSGSGPTGFGKKYGMFTTDSSGVVDYTEARWLLTINRSLSSMADNSTVTVVDTLPDGLTFTGFDYVAVYYLDSDDNAVMYAGAGTNANVVTYLSETLGGSYSYDATANTLTITLPASAFTITLTTGETTAAVLHFQIITSVDVDSFDLAAGSSVSIKNTMDVTYTVDGDTTPTTETGDVAYLQLVNSSAGAVGVEAGTLQVTKVVEGTTVPIEGVEFQVYQIDSNGDYVSGWTSSGTDYLIITTDEDGIALAEGLGSGYYEIREVSGPDWIVTASEGIVAVISGDTGTAVTIPNEVQTTDVTARKVWLTSSGETDTGTHPTIWFQLYRSIDGGSEEAVDGTLQELTDGTTEVTYTDLDQYDAYGNLYTYVVREVDAEGNSLTLSGWTKTEDGLTVTNQRTAASTSSPLRDVPRTSAE
jgi:hypothetical protein